MRHDSTDAEARLWFHLRDRRLDGFKFRRQFLIGDSVVDFCCWEERFVIEVDGGQHADRRNRDEQRTMALNQQGYRVLRFWTNEVLADTDSVLAAIRSALEQSR